jgi:molybdopterin molybdotransferase
MALADAVGQVLAEPIVAGVALPPWTNASMDGYAVCAADIAAASPEQPVNLRVISAIAAGGTAERTLRPGEAMRIFTGAPVPIGADSVVRQEDTNRGDAVVQVTASRDAHANVRLAGGDLARGTVALTAGSVLGPHQVALLAALGQAQPLVYRRPRVGILATGNEVVSLDQVDEILAGRRLGDVNSIALAALVTQTGAVAVPLGIAADTVAALVERVGTAGDVDLLISAGGVSVGDHDHVRTAMMQFGAVNLFDRVRMRPGGPTTFATLADGRRWLGLPGNPVSAMVTFDLFGRTAIRSMSGHPVPGRVPFLAMLAEPARPDRLLDQYLRCTFVHAGPNGPPVASLTGAQGSGMLMSVVRAEGLVLIPCGTPEIPAGSMVAATRFD